MRASRKQIEKFKKAARAAECDENEGAFDENLRRLVESESRRGRKLPKWPKKKTV